jgi:hypothetical protein
MTKRGNRLEALAGPEADRTEQELEIEPVRGRIPRGSNLARPTFGAARPVFVII